MDMMDTLLPAALCLTFLGICEKWHIKKGQVDPLSPCPCSPYSSGWFIHAPGILLQYIPIMLSFVLIWYLFRDNRLYAHLFSEKPQFGPAQGDIPVTWAKMQYIGAFPIIYNFFYIVQIDQVGLMCTKKARIVKSGNEFI